MRKFIYLCRDCGFLDFQGCEGDIDKCPHCKNDDWITYKREEDEE